MNKLKPLIDKSLFFSGYKKCFSYYNSNSIIYLYAFECFGKTLVTIHFNQFLLSSTKLKLIIALYLQDNLLLFNHAKLMGSDPRASGKDYLVATMFRMYDLNVNEVLEGEELDQVLTLFIVYLSSLIRLKLKISASHQQYVLALIFFFYLKIYLFP